MKLTNQEITKTVTLKRLAGHKLGLYLDDFKKPVAEIQLLESYNFDENRKPEKVSVTVLKMESATGISLHMEHGYELKLTLDRG